MRYVSSITLVVAALVLAGCSGQAIDAEGADETRVVVASQGWQLVGDLTLPPSESAVPAVLMLNKAMGNREPYRSLAQHLADRGVASLRIDLRGHGESDNLGRFDPADTLTRTYIWDSEADVSAAHAFLKNHAAIDARRIGLVGGSYSGEEMAEAGRLGGYGQAYVALSPGSFSDSSIAGIDASGVPWLFIVSENERFLHDIAAAVEAQSQSVEFVRVPGNRHASDILEHRPDMAERIAVWLARVLAAGD